MLQKEYGVRWTQWTSNRGTGITRAVKEKFFASAKAREQFVARLRAKDGFDEILAWHN